MPKTPFRLVALVVFLSLSLPSHAESTPHWFEIRSPHFVVLTDTNEKQARHLAGQFERMRSLFHALLPRASSDASGPIIVLALKNQKDFASLEPTQYLARGALDISGFFLRTPNQNYILLRLDDQGEHPFSVVYHEYTHFILRKSESWIPLWLNEGLAEFYQNTDIEDHDARFGQASVDDVLYLRDNRLIPLTTLLTIDHSSPYYHEEQKGSVFYAESWALTHYIEIKDHENHTQKLQDYANRLSHGQDSITAAQQAFGDLGQLQKALDAYVNQGSFMLFRIPITLAEDESKYQSIPVTLDDANAIRADVLAFDDRPADSRALLDAILHNDPNNALAHETMGSLCFERHDTACAKKWFGEAVQLHATDYLPYYYFAVISMRDGDTAQNDAIEAALRSSIQLEPTFAPAYDALATFFGRLRKNFDEAHHLNLLAIQLDPNELSYRIDASYILMQQQDASNALLVLKNAENTFTAPSDKASLEARIHDIESFQALRTQQQQQSITVTTTQTISAANSPAASSNEIVITGKSAAADEPSFPSPVANAAHHVVRGTLSAVKCTYPTTLTFQVDQPGKSTTLYSSNFYKISFAMVGFPSNKPLDVCNTLNGLHARVEYAEVSDKRVAGEVLNMTISK